MVPLYPIMENHVEKTMENEMEQGFRAQNRVYIYITYTIIGEVLGTPKGSGPRWRATVERGFFVHGMLMVWKPETLNPQTLNLLSPKPKP